MDKTDNYNVPMTTAMPMVDKYVLKNKLTILQRRIISKTILHNYAKVIEHCEELLQIEYPESI